MLNSQLNIRSNTIYSIKLYFVLVLITMLFITLLSNLDYFLHCEYNINNVKNINNSNYLKSIGRLLGQTWNIVNNNQSSTADTSTLHQDDNTVQREQTETTSSNPETSLTGTTTLSVNGKKVGSKVVFKNNDAHSPLDQFIIRDYLSFYFNVGYSTKFLFTNMSFYLVIVSGLVFVLNVIYNKLNLLTSNFWSFNKESLYATIHGVVINQIDLIKGQNFIPFIYTIFIYIFISNLIGMIPYNFSTTSHFILTFFISFTIVVGSTILGFTSFKTRFFSILVPSGCPTGLLPLLVLIETISYLARNVSLGLRLAANILSGHMLLNILSGFTYNIMASGFIFFVVGLIPLTFIMGFSTLEMGICFIQAQVFSVLSSSYIKDGLILH